MTFWTRNNNLYASRQTAEESIEESAPTQGYIAPPTLLKIDSTKDVFVYSNMALRYFLNPYCTDPKLNHANLTYNNVPIKQSYTKIEAETMNKIDKHGNPNYLYYLITGNNTGNNTGTNKYEALKPPSTRSKYSGINMNDFFTSLENTDDKSYEYKYNPKTGQLDNVEETTQSPQTNIIKSYTQHIYKYLFSTSLLFLFPLIFLMVFKRIESPFLFFSSIIAYSILVFPFGFWKKFSTKKAFGGNPLLHKERKPFKDALSLLQSNPTSIAIDPILGPTATLNGKLMTLTLDSKFLTIKFSQETHSNVNQKYSLNPKESFLAISFLESLTVTENTKQIEPLKNVIDQFQDDIFDKLDDDSKKLLADIQSLKNTPVHTTQPTSIVSVTNNEIPPCLPTTLNKEQFGN